MPAGVPRKKHLLSGLIRCGECGSDYTISEKDYYRCAGQKERGTCGNKTSVRKSAIETSTLAVLKTSLLTDDHARLFIEEFYREIARLSQESGKADEGVEARLRQIEPELHNLGDNLLQ
jgi:site-specific DNA recombinase